MDKAAIIKNMEIALGEALLNIDPNAHLDSKSMFGGAGFYVDGRMVAAWFGRGLALKLAEADRGELLKVEGASPTQSKQYVEVPAHFLDNPDVLAPWLARSIGYVKSAR
jgi:TfoX/Sxy family transcriptional regulator of competence genes